MTITRLSRHAQCYPDDGDAVIRRSRQWADELLGAEREPLREKKSRQPFRAGVARDETLMIISTAKNG